MRGGETGEGDVAQCRRNIVYSVLYVMWNDVTSLAVMWNYVISLAVMKAKIACGGA